MRLQADLGQRRFMDRLAGRDLSHVNFIFSDLDTLRCRSQALVCSVLCRWATLAESMRRETEVGTLTEAELAFLRMRGVGVTRLEGAGHRAAFEAEYAGDVTSALSGCGSIPADHVWQ